MRASTRPGWRPSYKLVDRLDRPVIRVRNVSCIALRDAGGDRTRVIVCSNEIDRFSDRLLPGLDVRRRIALKRRRALHSQRRETAQEPRLFQDALRMPGIIHIPHEECRFSLMRQSGESVGNSFELAYPGGSAGFRFFVASSGGEMGRRRENRFAQRLQPKADPEQAPFGFEVADLLGAVPDLFKKRLAPIDITLVCPTRKWVTNSVICGQDPVQECLSLVLQFLHA